MVTAWLILVGPAGLLLLVAGWQQAAFAVALDGVIMANVMARVWTPASVPTISRGTALTTGLALISVVASLALKFTWILFAPAICAVLLGLFEVAVLSRGRPAAQEHSRAPAPVRGGGS